ncbi:MAG: universal stress protein [Candidatus Rokubacteria bacterium]|nr:universal stress protein [Candidatus Rokubacteria bacterium]
MYKRILVATDGSKTSQLALEEALRLAQGGQTRLRLVHVIDSPYGYADAWYAAVAADLEAIQRAWRRAGQDILAQAATVAREAGVEVETALLETDGRRVSRAIVDEADRWGAEVIVIGSHGRQGLEHLLLGSVAEGVVRTARVPVLLVRGQ